MTRHRPPLVFVLGLACLGFAFGFGGWLIEYRRSDLVLMVDAANGNGEALATLGDRGLARGAAAAVAVAHLGLMLALCLLLLGAGSALLAFLRSSRQFALCSGVAAIAAALGHTLIQVIWLPVAGEPIVRLPLVMDAVACLFGIVLTGGLLMPEVIDAYSGWLEAPAAPEPLAAQAPVPH